MRLQRKLCQAMKRKRSRIIVLDPKDLERRCAAAKVTGRQFLSTLDPEEAQALAPVFPKGYAVKTTDAGTAQVGRSVRNRPIQIEQFMAES